MLPLRQILCPIDFSNGSYVALEMANDLARQFGAELTVLHVLAPLQPALGIVPKSEFDAARSTDAAQVLHRITAERVDAAVHRRGIISIGDPATEILKAIVHEKPDLVVIATHGLSGWRHLVFGSVTEAVVRLSEVPVFTVHGKRTPPTGPTAPPTEDLPTREAAQSAFEIPPRPDVDRSKPPQEPTINVDADDPWSVKTEDFPKKGSATEKLRFLLNYAVLAPSSHNAQPWLWQLDGDNLELFADRTRALPVVDPDDRELIVSCGAALFNLRLAMRHFGYRCNLALMPTPSNPDLLARVSLGDRLHRPATSQSERRLFAAITHRHTNRTLLHRRAIPTPLRQALKDAARREGARLRFVAGDERELVLDFIERGDLIQGSDKEFRRELAAWIAPNHSSRKDGIPGHALRMSNVASHLAPLAIRALDIGKSQASSDHILAANAPLLAILETESDSSRDWLAAGLALQAVLLRACSEGVAASFFNQPIEVAGLWRGLRQELNLKLAPQLLFRLGYPVSGIQLQPTPRRPVDAVVVQNIVSHQALQEFIQTQRGNGR